MCHYKSILGFLLAPSLPSIVLRSKLSDDSTAGEVF
jgi:hypothetical protein